MGRGRILKLLTLLLLATLGAMANAATAPRHVGFSQLQHSVFLDDDPESGVISQIVQDSDGFLWLLTDRGIVRYDGASFTDMFQSQLAAFPSPLVFLLGPRKQASDIWVGHRTGGMTHLVNGIPTHYEGNGLPSGSVFSLIRDAQGIVWAASTTGVVRFIDGHWRALPASLGYVTQHPESLEFDRSNADVYVQDENRGFLVLHQGGATFEVTSGAKFEHAANVLPKDVQWDRPKGSDGPYIYGHDGSIWYADDRGLTRFYWSDGDPKGAPDKRENITTEQGLSHNIVFDIFEDREGSIWVGTERGLDRFRFPHFTPLSVDKDLDNPGMVLSSDGALWISSETSAPYRFDVNGKVSRVDALKDGASAIDAESDGTVWLAGINGVRSWRDGRVSFVSVPDELKDAGTRLRHIAVDGDGGLWLGAATFGLYRELDGSWERVSGKYGLPDGAPSFLGHGIHGELVAAYPTGQVVEISVGDGVTTRLVEGVNVGRPSLAVVHGDDLWIGGSKGLGVSHHGTFRTVALLDHAFESVQGITFTRQGVLWIADASGAYQVAAEQVASFQKGSDGPLSSTHYGLSEGLGVQNAPSGTSGSLLFDGTGYVWHASSANVSYIREEGAHLNAVVPRPSIQAVVSEHGAANIADGAKLPPLTRSVRIDYTAPMLRRPERADFQYRLDGVDTAWQNAGTRRSAYYTNLTPGDYTFHVKAFNEDGIRGDQDVTFPIHLEAAWYQTLLFKLLVLVMLLLAIWQLFNMRLRAVTHRMRIRNDERERIARDLHDTLLQGFQGLLLQFQAVRRYIESANARSMIDESLKHAQQMLVEGRDKVTALRLKSSDEGDLAKDLLAVGEGMRQGHSAVFEMVVQGKMRRLRAVSHEEVFLIGREAIVNAFRHANASRVSVTLDFRRQALTVIVNDDGVGFDVHESRPSHFGVQGMHERARELGGGITVNSGVGLGTRVTLRVRAKQAYL